MTEAEWLKCTDPDLMLQLIRGRITARKLRLFACACCRRIWHLGRPETRRIVEIAEAHADDSATFDQLEEQAGAASDSAGLLSDYAFASLAAPNGSPELEDAAFGAVDAFADATAGVVTDETRIPERTKQAFLLRCIAGNPFRRVALTPLWLTPTVCSLAGAIYTDRAFDRLPILADALEDAGCTDAAILDHCRQPGEHVRGCWVVDLLLGKR